MINIDHYRNFVFENIQMKEKFLDDCFECQVKLVSCACSFLKCTLSLSLPGHLNRLYDVGQRTRVSSKLCHTIGNRRCSDKRNKRFEHACRRQQHIFIASWIFSQFHVSFFAILFARRSSNKHTNLYANQIVRAFANNVKKAEKKLMNYNGVEVAIVFRAEIMLNVNSSNFGETNFFRKTFKSSLKLS